MAGKGENGGFMARMLTLLAELRQQTEQGALQVEICKAMWREHEQNQRRFEENQRQFEEDMTDFHSALQETIKALRQINDRLSTVESDRKDMDQRIRQDEERMQKFDERLRKGNEADLVLAESLRHLTVFIQTVGKEVEGLKSRVDSIENR